eukprot:COSAG06_NODE_6147_length_3086_cov_24.392779_4_plen_59_part_01
MSHGDCVPCGSMLFQQLQGVCKKPRSLDRWRVEDKLAGDPKDNRLLVVSVANLFATDAE